MGFEIAKKIKCRWDIYYLDPYSYNQSTRLSKTLFPYRFIRELPHFIHSSNLYLTNELFDEYNNNFIMSIFKKKFTKLGIPALNLKNRKKQPLRSHSQNIIDFVYTGMFYDNIRHPQLMIDTFIKLNSVNKNIRLTLYDISLTDLKKYINQEKIPSFIKLRKRVNRNELDEVLNRNVFLVNIGNSVDNQLPSKIVDYVSTGNPIINFISIENDTSMKFLKNYPNKFNFSKFSIIEELELFIIKFNGKRIPSDKIEHLYFDETVQAIASKIVV